MKAAWDLGINTINTANICSNGNLVAKFIKKVCSLLTRPSPVSIPGQSKSG
jgi:diketogulonate reductase-like aldo/keto reductase